MDSVLTQMQERLPPEVIALLRAAADVAQQQGQQVYLVGGAVRDLLLGYPNLDFDLVVEGDAPRLAQQLGQAVGAEVVVHDKFGTASLQREALCIDLATARSETYSRPGALPDVTPALIQDDLFRRDFSMNAMAVDLSAASFGRLIDPFHGRADMERGLVRVLHDRSFIDDATRILRALRYEQRFGFRLEEATEKLLRRDVSMLDTISGDRIRHELELDLKEDRPELVMGRAGELGVLSALHPSLTSDGWLADRFEQARQQGLQAPDVYLLLLIYRLSDKDNEQVVTRLNPPGELARHMRQVPKLRKDLDRLTEHDLAPSAICRLLAPFSSSAIIAAMLGTDTPVVRSRLKLYLDKLRYVKPCLDGEDLKRLGVAQGPLVGKMLRRLHDARLDGIATTRETEESLVRQWLEQDCGERIGGYM